MENWCAFVQAIFFIYQKRMKQMQQIVNKIGCTNTWVDVCIALSIIGGTRWPQHIHYLILKPTEIMLGNAI